MRRFRLALLSIVCFLFVGAGTAPAHAANKDIIQLQTQVQQLSDAVARLQQTSDERWGVLKDLVQQTADSVNKMTVVVNGVNVKVQNLQNASGQKSDQLSGQVQSLNDSLDELRARLGRIEKSLGDIQASQQATSAALTNIPQGGAPAAGPGGASPATQPNPSMANNNPVPVGKPNPGTPLNTVTPGAGEQSYPVQPGASAGPSADEMYRTAYGDYMSGKNALSASEFGELIKAYPDDNLAGNAYYYLGEMDLRGGKPSAAIRDYDHVLEHYPDNSKLPAAHLHKGDALVAMRQNEAGIREYRALIQRFPNSPEAAQARAKISIASRR